MLLPDHTNWLSVVEQSWNQMLFTSTLPGSLSPLSSPGLLIKPMPFVLLAEYSGIKILNWWYQKVQKAQRKERNSQEVTILSKAVKPCKFKIKGINLTVLKVTNYVLILNVKSIQIHLLPSQHYWGLDLGQRKKIQKFVFLLEPFLFSAFLDLPLNCPIGNFQPMLTKLILWSIGKTSQVLSNHFVLGS